MAADLQLDIRISNLNEEETHQLLPVSGSKEEGEATQETQGVFTTHREPLTSPPSIVTQEGQSTDLPDKPGIMTTQTTKEEEIIIRAESLHINNLLHQVDERRINPNTGHMELGDAAAINRAVGPNRLNPPLERAFPQHGGGSGGGGGGGGQPVGWGTLPAPPQQADGKLYSLAPDTFTGNCSKVKDFITQWEQYWSLNYNNTLMRVPLHLSYVVPHLYQRGPDD